MKTAALGRRLAANRRRTYAAALMITKSRNILLLGLGLAVGLSLGLAGGVLADKPAALADRPAMAGRAHARRRAGAREA